MKEALENMECEVSDTNAGFKFRLVNKRTGQKTLWCGYTMHCYLDGWVAASQYYLPESKECRPIDPDEFCRLTASGILEYEPKEITK
jgi:hypothetical protein